MISRYAGDRKGEARFVSLAVTTRSKAELVPDSMLAWKQEDAWLPSHRRIDHVGIVAAGNNYDQLLNYRRKGGPASALQPGGAILLSDYKPRGSGRPATGGVGL